MSSHRSIVVIGAGGLGREVRDAVEAARHLGVGPPFGGFLDDSATGANILGQLAGAEELVDAASFIVAIGDSSVRARVAAALPAASDFATVVHPAAVVSPRAELAPGCFVAPLSYVGTGARLGSHTVVNVHAQVGHDVTTGAFATLSPMVALNGHSILGDGCFLGTGASVGVGVSIGRWCKVAAGSRVTKTFGDGCLLVGNPASGRQFFRPPSD